MGELMALLERRGYRMAESELAEALDELLPNRSEPVASLSSADRDYLARYSGALPASAAQVEALSTRRVAAVTADVARSFSRAEVAQLLGITPSRVSHRQSDGQLYAFRAGPGRLLYPDWQFEKGAPVLPHLGRVLGAIEPGANPAALRRFMLTPDPDLLIAGRPVSPRDWLLAGGDIEEVVSLVSSFGDQG